MKVYRIALRRDGGEHDSYEYYTNKAVAEKLQKEDNASRGPNDVEDEVETIEFKPTKKGIIDMLNNWAAYPDNG